MGAQWPNGLERWTGDRRPGGPSSWGRILLRQICFGTLAKFPFTPLCQCLSEETLKAIGHFYLVSIGLYRENANVAIDSEAYRDPNGGNVYDVTMQITFHIPELAGKERNLH